VDDISIVDREVRIEAPPDVVAAFFTDPAKIATWMASRARVDPRARGRLRLEFDRADGTTDVVVGEFVEITSRRIVFTWGFEGRADLAPGATRVEVTLEAEGSGTRVRLVHRDLPDADREAHAGGWTYFLERLASAAKAA
jgi:uncharacterized protein YndB with AHSA1/START domain